MKSQDNPLTRSKAEKAHSPSLIHTHSAYASLNIEREGDEWKDDLWAEFVMGAMGS